MKNIAIVSSDITDFKNWLIEQKLEGSMVDSPMKINVDDNVYCCVYKPTHTISMVFDSIIETKNARKSGAYSSTLTQTKSCLRSNNEKIRT